MMRKHVLYVYYKKIDTSSWRNMIDCLFNFSCLSSLLLKPSPSFHGVINKFRRVASEHCVGHINKRFMSGIWMTLLRTLTFSDPLSLGPSISNSLILHIRVMNHKS